MKISRLDHLVLTVKDLDKTCDFYSSVLGMETQIFLGNRRALKFGAQKINLHQAESEFEPRAASPTSGSADLCFLCEGGVEGLQQHLEASGVAIIEGPVMRSGAQGAIDSIYCRDPDGNLIELSVLRA